MSGRRDVPLPPDRLKFSRRSLLKAGVLGAAALTGAAARPPAPALAAESDSASSAPGVYQFNQGWLFGGPYVSGADAPGYSEHSFAAVTLPHTVTPLSWGDWDATSWQQLWIYRKHLSAPANAGTRVFLDFQGVMTSATVFLGGVQIAQHQGGFLPFSVELTERLAAGDNLLAVVVDARWLDVPPDGASAGAVTVTTCSRAASTATRRCGSCPRSTSPTCSPSPPTCSAPTRASTCS